MSSFDDHFIPPDPNGLLPVPPNPAAEPIRPVMPNNQPGPNPFLRTTLPPSFGGASPDSLRHFYNPAMVQSRLVPLGPAANASANAPIQSAVKAASTSAPPDIDPFLHFRGTWQSFTPYAINDVVLFNNSAYVAIAASRNVEPDSGPATVRQGGNSQNWAGGGRAASFTFASNLLAGSTILVSVESGNLANQGGSLLTPTDSQGNTYTLVAQASVTDSGGGVYACATYIATAQAGACTVSAQWSTFFGFGGVACTATEILGLIASPVDTTTSASLVAPIGGSSSVPGMALSCTQAFDLIYSACQFSGTGVANQTNPPGFAPPGFSPYLLSSGNIVSGAVVAQSTFIGNNAIQWGAGLTNGERFVATAVSLKTVPPTWVLLGKNLNFRGVWSSPNPVRQNAWSSTANGTTTNATFPLNVLAGSTIIVSTMVQNIGASAVPLLSDTQGNVYTQVVVSPRVDSNEYQTQTWIATAQAGALSVNVTWTNGGAPGNDFLFISEATGLAGVDGTTSAGTTGTSGAFPSMTLNSTNAGEFIYTAVNNGDASLTAPPGYFSFLHSQNGPAWFTPSVQGNNTVQWGGSFNFTNTRFTATAVSFFLAGNNYYPYDVAEFNGSMYLCIVATNGSPASSPSSWTLFAQSTGFTQVKTAAYVAGPGDEGTLLSFNAASAVTLTLPGTPPDSGWWVLVQNLSSNTLTINPNGLLIDTGSGSLTLAQFSGMLIFTDGTNYFTEHDLTSLSVPSIFTFSVNSSGVGTIGLASQSANLLWASPNGSSGTPVFRQAVEADISMSDNTTDNVSTTKHGFAPKAPNDATKFLDGTGNYSSALPQTVASASGTLKTGTVSGVLRLPGNVVPPAGTYRVSVNFFLQANPSAGTLDVNIGWNDGTAARSATNGTLGAPADISTAALNAADGTIVLVSDGVHDVTWAMTLT